MVSAWTRATAGYWQPLFHSLTESQGSHLQYRTVPGGCAGGQRLPEGAVQMYRALQAPLCGPSHGCVGCCQRHACRCVVMWGRQIKGPSCVAAKELDLRHKAVSHVQGSAHFAVSKS